MPSTVRDKITAVDAALIELAERAARLDARERELEQRLVRAEQRLARGTGDLTSDLLTAEWSPVPTRETPAPVLPPAADPATELQRLLRAAPMSVADAALALGIPVAHAAQAMRSLRRGNHVVNVGSTDEPRWSWVLGDECSTTDLTAKVEQLIRLRPMTLAELQAATGARRNRISGAIVLLRRHGVQVVNRGNGWRAVWAIPAQAKRR